MPDQSGQSENIAKRCPPPRAVGGGLCQCRTRLKKILLPLTRKYVSSSASVSFKELNETLRAAIKHLPNTPSEARTETLDDTMV